MPADVTSVVVNGRTYDRNERGRWSYQPANGHKRTQVHPTSRLQHALDALAASERQRRALEHAGLFLANAAFNVSQNPALDERTRASLKEAQERWDKVVRDA